MSVLSVRVVRPLLAACLFACAWTAHATEPVVNWQWQTGNLEVSEEPVYVENQVQLVGGPVFGEFQETHTYSELFGHYTNHLGEEYATQIRTTSFTQAITYEFARVDLVTKVLFLSVPDVSAASFLDLTFNITGAASATVSALGEFGQVTSPRTGAVSKAFPGVLLDGVSVPTTSTGLEGNQRWYLNQWQVAPSQTQVLSIDNHPQGTLSYVAIEARSDHFGHYQETYIQRGSYDTWMEVRVTPVPESGAPAMALAGMAIASMWVRRRRGLAKG